MIPKIPGETPLHDAALKLRAEEQPIQCITFLDKSDSIIGGVFFVRGEREFEQVRALILPRQPARGVKV